MDLFDVFSLAHVFSLKEEEVGAVLQPVTRGRSRRLGILSLGSHVIRYFMQSIIMSAQRPIYRYIESDCHFFFVSWYFCRYVYIIRLKEDYSSYYSMYKISKKEHIQTI